MFAAQWLIAILVGLFFFGAQLFAPDFCAEMLQALAQIADDSPPIMLLWEQLIDKLAAWLPMK